MSQHGKQLSSWRSRDPRRKVTLSSIALSLTLVAGSSAVWSVATAVAQSQDDASASAMCDIEAAACGLLSDALATSRMIDEAQWRLLALDAVARVQIDAGLSEWAATTLNEMLETVDGIDDDQPDAMDRHVALGIIASAMARIDRIDEALAIVDRIPTASTARDVALAEVAAMYSLAGRADDALEITRPLTDYGRNLATARLARLQLEDGRLQEAAALASEIEDDSMRVRLLLDIAAAQLDAGLDNDSGEAFALATAAARALEDEAARDSALREVAAGLSNAGRFNMALVVAGEIRHEAELAAALIAIAEGQARAGQNVEAQSVIRRIPASMLQLEAFCLVARAQSERGNGELARETLAAAVTAADALDDVSRLLALGDIAFARARIGDTAAAQQAFSQVLIAARQIDGSQDRDWVLEGLALDLASVGLFDQALATADEMTPGMDRLLFILPIGLSLAEAGHLEDARQFYADQQAAVEMDLAGGGRQSVLQAIAVSQAKAAAIAADTD